MPREQDKFRDVRVCTSDIVTRGLEISEERKRDGEFLWSLGSTVVFINDNQSQVGGREKLGVVWIFVLDENNPGSTTTVQ